MVCQLILHLRPLSLALNETGVSQDLEVLRDARNGHPRLYCERLDMARRLGKKVQDFESLCAPESFSYPSELRVDEVFRRAGFHATEYGTCPWARQ